MNKGSQIVFNENFSMSFSGVIVHRNSCCCPLNPMYFDVIFKMMTDFDSWSSLTHKITQSMYNNGHDDLISFSHRQKPE